MSGGQGLGETIRESGMFSLGYLIWSSSPVPLARTVLQHWAPAFSRLRSPPLPGPRLYRRGDRAIILLEMIFTVSLQNYWFGELGQQYRYWFALGLRAAIFTTVFVLGGCLSGST